MCGIAGIFTVAPHAELDATVAKMLDLIKHRGPDDAGVWSNSHVALGNRRLSILDLSPTGHQPMTNADQSLWVVQNGEIYNFEQVRSELQQAGYAFRSQGDTEVILQAYAHWGVEFVRHLRGMFAIALWDERQKRLLLARDRFGIKPLYYRLEQRQNALWLAFASEIKPILAIQSSPRQPNEALIYDFLAHGLLEHTDETFFSGVQKLPPAHIMVLDQTGQVTQQRYWDFAVNPDFGCGSQQIDQKYAEEFRNVFFDSVAHHMVSDVTVGAYLSGGLDSSAVLCTADRLTRSNRLLHVPAHVNGGDQRRIQTFTSCFDDMVFDERAYANTVIEQIQANPHYIFPQPGNFLTELPKIIYHQEEPFGGMGIYANWCIAREVSRAGLKVVLSGQGGDEQLLGYGKFYLFYLSALAQQHQYGRFLRESLSIGLSPDFLRFQDIRHGLRYMGRHLSRLSQQPDLLASAFADQFATRQHQIGSEAGIASRIKQDITRYSLPVLLRYEDKNSMAFSVELRVPFVDHVLVEYIAALPLNQKLRAGWTKYVLRQSLKDVLPALVKQRKSKLGFSTPEASWFKSDLAQEFERTFEQATFLPMWTRIPALKEAFSHYQRHPTLMSPNVFFRHFVTEKWASTFLA